MSSERAPRPRIMGLETEYGISLLGSHPEDLHPMYLSNHVIRSYADLIDDQGPTGWDFSTESPLVDQRGFSLDRDEALPDQLTDIDNGLANMVLTNGARLYVDHAHPEYAGPEVTSALAAVRWDRAGDALMVRGARAASSKLSRDLRLYKNNTDGKGASYGTHENYQLSRKTPFHRVINQFTGFLVSRVPLVGAGRIGLGQASERTGFQISQRADFFEAEVGLETTVKRPIINTRDEPHADARFSRRLHVITGDANRCDVANYVKMGAASFVLRAIEADLYSELPLLSDPVNAIHDVSHDLDCSLALPCLDGTTITALGLQQVYLDGVRRLIERGDLTDADLAEAADVCDTWQELLDDLGEDPARCADRLDWVAKYQLMQRFRDRDRLGWDAPKLALIDVQYTDLDPTRSLFATLERSGRIKRLVSDAEIESAINLPPEDTRAYFRGHVMKKFGREIVAASWDSVIFSVSGERGWQRLPMLDPQRGTRQHVGAVIEAAPDAATLLLRITR